MGPDYLSRLLSIVIISLFMITLGIAAYLTSYLKGQISADIFTISQSLAYGNKPIIVILLVITFLLLASLVFYRSNKINYLLYIRLFLLLVISSFVITITWVTTYYDPLAHYILAFIAFVVLILFIVLNSYSIYNIKLSLLEKIILILIPILSVLSLSMLFISYIVPKLRHDVKELFPSLENTNVFIFILSILSLGFI